MILLRCSHAETEFIIRHSRFAAFTLVATLGIGLAAAQPARADQRYTVSGSDLYQIGAALPNTRIEYAGSERLVVTRSGKSVRYRAIVRYMRADASGERAMRASFVQEMRPSGSLEDRADNDPDFLAVLNQPFAIELDAKTLRDIAHLHGEVPFRATSPLGSSILHGYLKPGTDGLIDGRPVVGVRFDAHGPMSGSLPSHPATAIHGTIRMDGTAYYATPGALLLALDATLDITGKLQNGADEVPVRIIYRRTIRATHPAL